IAKYFKYFERKSYTQADMIGVMSEKNLKIFESVHHEIYPTTILRNWAALQPYRDTNSALSFRKKLSLQDKVIFFYGGNIGHAQDMANLMRLARSMQIYP
ncbi:glycosyltransferase WbuB, partial [Vibrio parahaemolyticus]